MTLRVDPLLRNAQFLVAAVTETKCRAWAKDRLLFGTGSKRPLAIVATTNDQIRTFDLAGREIERSEFQKQFPNALDQFNALLCLSDENGLYDAPVE